MKTIAKQFLKKVGKDQAQYLMYSITPSYFRAKREKFKELGVKRNIDINASILDDYIQICFTDGSMIVFDGEEVEAC
jgi:hypothetical protein